MGFRYLAYDSNGAETRGVLQVESEQTAEQMLWDRGLTVAELKPVRSGLDLTRIFPTYFGPKKRDLIVFSNQLANLIESGIAIVPALALLADEVSSKSLRKVIRQVHEDVNSGDSITAALAKHDHVFPPIYSRMVQVGERTGNLALILRRLATYMEKEESVLGKIRSAMVYPIFILVMAVGVIGILMNFTLPPLLQLYDDFQAELPLPTQILLWTTNILLKYQGLILAGIVLLVLGIALYITRPFGRRQLDLLLLKVPILGKINLQGNVARLSRTLATTLRAGLQLPESLELTSQIIGNVILAKNLEDLRQETLQGRGIATPISQLPIFPSMLAQVVRVGEETGTLDSHLETLAQFYEEEVDRSLKTVTTLVEPLMIVLVGGIVAFVAISMILPMYSLLSSIK
jgi:type IV pilus assembly protein PilC